MATATMLDALETLQSTPPAEWQAWADTHDPEDIKDMAEALEKLAIRAATMGRYLSYRTVGYGQTHADGVKAMNKARTAIRKALGFSYPQDDLHI